VLFVVQRDLTSPSYNDPFIPSEVLEITKLEAQCIVLLEVSNP
jgi:hypothetical protein